MGDNKEITLDSLVQDELSGKANAISEYDDILWKIRSGYAVLLYGSVGIVVGLVNNEILVLSNKTLTAVSLLILGFSIFAALIDYSFLESKLRVVNNRDKLINYAYEKSISGSWSVDKDTLLDALINSGERKLPVSWSGKTGKSRLYMYYGGTCLVCAIAVCILF